MPPPSGPSLARSRATAASAAWSSAPCSTSEAFGTTVGARCTSAASRRASPRVSSISAAGVVDERRALPAPRRASWVERPRPFLQAARQRPDHRAEPGPFRFDDARHPELAQRVGGDRADGDGEHVPVERVGQAVLVGRDLERVVHGVRRRERHGVDLAVGDGVEEASGRRHVLGHVPAVHRDVDDLARPQVGERGRRTAARHRRAARRSRWSAMPSAARRARISSFVSVGAVHVDLEADLAGGRLRLRAAGHDLGPVERVRAARPPCRRSRRRRTTSARRSRSSGRPGRRARRARARSPRSWRRSRRAARSSSSARARTRAPRRDSISACSSQRRCPVMPIVKPASGRRTVSTLLVLIGAPWSCDARVLSRRAVFRWPLSSFARPVPCCRDRPVVRVVRW